MKRVTLATYNTLLGGHKPWRSSLMDLIHFSYFILGSKILLNRSKKRIVQTMRFCTRKSPDIVVLTEIPTHTDKRIVRRFFRKFGHRTIVAGRSKYFKQKDMELGVIVASKFKGTPLHLPSKFINSSWGSCGMYIKKINTVVIGVHLSVFKWNRMEELTLLKEFINTQIKKQRKVIVAGDFNTNQEEIISHFHESKPHSLNLSTYAHWLMPEMAIDNVLVFGGKNTKSSTESDLSDHKKIFSEIELYS